MEQSMKDIFKLAINQSIGIGGYHCHCCNPISRRNPRRSRDKTRLHRTARARMKQSLIGEKMND